jgi:hypothetical protein
MALGIQPKAGENPTRERNNEKKFEATRRWRAIDAVEAVKQMSPKRRYRQ